MRSGACYRFHGLPDSGPSTRTITVLSISTGGSIYYRIDMDGEKRGESLFSVPLSEALLLIEHGVWTEVK